MDKIVCDCTGIRVWRGFAKGFFKDNYDDFLKKLGSVFIPETAQKMSELGLQAYFPAIVPKHSRPLPHEIALVVYPSQDIYTSASRNTVAGRAYGLLHDVLFTFDRNEKHYSKSGFPENWNGSLELGNAYSLFNSKIQWQSGSLRASVALLRQGANESDIERIFNAYANDSSSSQITDNVIFVVEDGYLLVWEHMPDVVESQLLHALAPMIDTLVYSKIADQTNIPPLFSGHDQGVEVSDTSFLDVRISV